MTTWLAIALIIGAYILGSISFAVLVSKAMGLPNPYSYGSGNPGATIVLRTGNKKAAILTLLGDALKGFVAVMVACLLGWSRKLLLPPSQCSQCAIRQNRVIHHYLQGFDENLQSRGID